MRRVAFLWLPHWPTDRLRGRSHDADAQGPLVVSRTEGPRLIIAAACPQATRLGLHRGMKLAHAQAMVPGLRVHPEQAQADQDALAGLAVWCLRYTPSTRALAPDGIWLDLTGCAHLHGGEHALLCDLAARLGDAGLHARIALADTPGGAHALAHHAEAALTIAPEGALSTLLSPLPVQALRLDEAAITLLHRFGLNRIGDIAALPRAPLARRLGSDVARRLDQAFGRLQEPIEPALPDLPAAERLAFAEPLLTPDSLSAAIARLTDRLCKRLQARSQGARRLELLFERIDSSVQTQSVALAAASHAPRHIARLFDNRLEQLDPGEGIEAMTLTAILSETMRSHQNSLGLSELALDTMTADLAPLIDRLASRLGTRRIWRPQPVQSDVPERTVRVMPPLGPPLDPPASNTPASNHPASNTQAVWPVSLPRPIRLFDPPMAVRTMTVLPDSPPSFFIWRNHRHRVRRADGPERIAGEWWRRPGEFLAVRDYFRLEDETGRRFWLFRRGDGTDPQTGDLRWFLHGLF